MYKRIKELADEAIALQNKNRMDEVLREISGIAWAESMKTCFEDKRVEELQRQLADSVTLASAPSGFVASGLQLEGAAQFKPGEFKPVGAQPTETAESTAPAPSIHDMNATTVAATNAAIKGAAKKGGAK